MTRVLITSLNYAPEETGIAPYSTQLAEHLASRGYRVTVLAGVPHYPQWRVDPAYARGAPQVEVRNGVEVRRSRHYVPARQSALHRGLYELTSLSMALRALDVPRPHAVLGVVPSLSGGVVARAVSMRFGVPYGLVFQDLVGQAAEQSGVGAGRGVSAAVRAAEGWAARGAAAIGIVAEGFRPYLEARGVDPGRIRRVRNWTHTPPARVARDEMRARLGWGEGEAVCLHAGNMGYKQGLENVIECARLAAQVALPLRFVLMGDGNQRTRLEGLARQYRLPNVEFLPLQDGSLYPSVLAAADVLLLNQRGSVSDMSLPSKFTSYCAAGRPVVAAAAASSETAREVTASSAGIVVEPDEPGALLDALLRATGDAGLAAYLGERGREWAEEALSATAALRAYEQLLAAILAAGRSGRVHTAGRQAPAAADRAANDGEERRTA